MKKLLISQIHDVSSKNSHKNWRNTGYYTIAFRNVCCTYLVMGVLLTNSHPALLSPQLPTEESEPPLLPSSAYMSERQTDIEREVDSSFFPTQSTRLILLSWTSLWWCLDSSLNILYIVVNSSLSPHWIPGTE